MSEGGDLYNGQRGCGEEMRAFLRSTQLQASPEVTAEEDLHMKYQSKHFPQIKKLHSHFAKTFFLA